MGTGIAQFWHWIVFTVLWLVVPVAISLILFRPRARSTCHKRCWVTCLLTAIVVLGFVSMNSRQLKILICRIPLAAENSWQDRHGLDPFRFDLMLWSLSGNPPHNLQETIQTAREALLRLEYFEQRDFHLRNSEIHEVLLEADRTSFKDTFWIMGPYCQERFR